MSPDLGPYLDHDGEDYECLLCSRYFVSLASLTDTSNPQPSNPLPSPDFVPLELASDILDIELGLLVDAATSLVVGTKTIPFLSCFPSSAASFLSSFLASLFLYGMTVRNSNFLNSQQHVFLLEIVGLKYHKSVIVLAFTSNSLQAYNGIISTPLTGDGTNNANTELQNTATASYYKKHISADPERYQILHELLAIRKSTDRMATENPRL